MYYFRPFFRKGIYVGLRSICRWIRFVDQRGRRYGRRSFFYWQATQHIEPGDRTDNRILWHVATGAAGKPYSQLQ